VIEFCEAHKVYAQGRRRVVALKGVSLTVRRGEFLAVTGPSGSGKSTLLHLAAGLDVPTAGSVRVGGRDLAALDDEALTGYRRDEVGLVFQFFNLIPTLNVLENVALPALIPGGRMRDALPAARALLERVGLAERLTHLPEELSGGEMQRVAVARALVRDPPLLLADEPTGNLDSATGQEILALLQSLRADRTVIVVTHDAKIASQADREVRLRDGQVEERVVG
jgi:putative ABC transport system ATP-binding protein